MSDMFAKDNENAAASGAIRSAELCRRFSLSEIETATNHFDKASVIGNGGFGEVYKGFIDNNGTTTVAIKRLKDESKQGAKEFWTEVKMLSKLRHTHLVALIGYCNEREEMILVYEYIAHGTLADHLYKISRKESGSSIPPLAWEQRLQICVGSARGLDYLHTGTHESVIHRDVKTTNILLDEEWVAKISDFGLSKSTTSQSMTHVRTELKGTWGYLDPEYFKTYQLTKKSDVYAFGVVLLEVLCGRPPVDRKLEEEQISLVLWAQHYIKKGKPERIVEPFLIGQMSPQCLKLFVEVANKCLRESSKARPTMAEVVGRLEFVLALQRKGKSEGIFMKMFNCMNHWWSWVGKCNSKSESKKDNSSKSESEAKDNNSKSKSETKDSSSKSESPKSESEEKDNSSKRKSETKDNSSKSESDEKDNSSKSKSEMKDNSSKSDSDAKDNSSKSKSKMKDNSSKSESPKSESEEKDNKSKSESEENDNSPKSESEKRIRRFSLAEILEATEDFNNDLLIALGGSSKVYKGFIGSGTDAVAIKITVAIKRLKAFKQGAREFWTEVEMLSTLRHPHLVALIGYCDEREEMILVYEYIAHGTLADHLYNISKKESGTSIPPLVWEQRLQICVGSARGLDYLHTGTHQRVIHRDVKTTNILLDEEWVAKISNFGTASQSMTHDSTELIGTLGYLDPNYFFTHQLTRKSDVYAFGVVLLEVLCGRPPVDRKLEEEQISLVHWAQHYIKKGKPERIVEPFLIGQISPQCLKLFVEVANHCLHKNSKARPTMAEVVGRLEFVLALHRKEKQRELSP